MQPGVGICFGGAWLRVPYNLRSAHPRLIIPEFPSEPSRKGQRRSCNRRPQRSARLPRQTPVAALLAQASQVIIAPDLIRPGYGPSLTQEGRGANDATRHH